MKIKISFLVAIWFIQLAILPKADGQIFQENTWSTYYLFDKSDITKEMEDLIYRKLKPYAGQDQEIDSLILTGHTDAKGTKEYNMALSIKRALNLANYIKEHFPSLPAKKIRYFGQGKKDPLYSEDSLNRRVDILVYPSPPKPISGLKNPVLGSVPLELDTAFFLPEIYFREDSPILTPSSQMAIPSMIQGLKRYKDHFLKINGYCNYLKPGLAKTDPLFILSVSRAKVIYDLLIDAGFDQKNLTYVGMGNSSLKNPNAKTKEEMRQNMRVLIEVYRNKP